MANTSSGSKSGSESDSDHTPLPGVMPDRLPEGASAPADFHPLAVAASLADQVGGANVEFIRVEGADRIALRVIERGVGWTRACGTGSCAVAAVANDAGLCGTDVYVDNPGGTLRVTLDGDHATLAGPVQFVANVEWLAA